MVIRNYIESDERNWLRCRMASFLDCSYYNDVKTKKEIYEHPSICLVAEDKGVLVGFIDAELDSNDLACNNGERGAVIWHLGVLPEYRKKGVAKQLWLRVKEQLLQREIHYCEVWTQEDIPANLFYRSMGFILEKSQTWLRCYVSGKQCMNLLNRDMARNIYGVEEMVFDVPATQKDKWKDMCFRMDEVRLYRISF